MKKYRASKFISESNVKITLFCVDNDSNGWDNEASASLLKVLEDTLVTNTINDSYVDSIESLEVEVKTPDKVNKNE